MMKSSNKALCDGSTSHNEDYINQLHDNNCLTDKGKIAWFKEAYNRNNFGLVYNYFCPDDQVVSMMPIQGMGWRGIPKNIARLMGENIRQRVFCKDESVGEKTDYLYVAKGIRKLSWSNVSVPEPKIKDPEIPPQDVSYFYNDVIVNAPLLPVSFDFELNGQENDYRSNVDGNDINISRAALMAEFLIEETVDVPDTPEFRALPLSQPLNNKQLIEVGSIYNITAISGRKVSETAPNYYTLNEKLKVKRRITEAEMAKMLEKGTTYSQHSSIISNDDVPEKAMTYDLAIGQCKAFDDTAFWRSLLLQADWRRPENPDSGTKQYYMDGILPEGIKLMMNKPESGKKPMPTGKDGVLNDYGPRKQTDWRNGEQVPVEQWVSPEPLPWDQL